MAKIVSESRFQKIDDQGATDSFEHPAVNEDSGQMIYDYYCSADRI